MREHGYGCWTALDGFVVDILGKLTDYFALDDPSSNRNSTGYHKRQHRFL